MAERPLPPRTPDGELSDSAVAESPLPNGQPRAPDVSNGRRSSLHGAGSDALFLYHRQTSARHGAELASGLHGRTSPDRSPLSQQNMDMPNYKHPGTAMHNPLHLTGTPPLGPAQKGAKPGENVEAVAAGRSRVAVGRAGRADDAPEAYTDWEQKADRYCPQGGFERDDSGVAYDPSSSFTPVRQRALPKSVAPPLGWNNQVRHRHFLFFSVCRSPFVIFFSIYESVMRAQESITSPLEDEGRIPGPEDNSKSRHGGHSHTGRGSDGGDSDDDDAGDNNSSGGGGGGYRGVGNHSASSGSGDHSDKEGGDDNRVVSSGVRPEPSCAHQGHGVYRLVFALYLRPTFCSHARPSRLIFYMGNLSGSNRTLTPSPNPAAVKAPTHRSKQKVVHSARLHTTNASLICRRPRSVCGVKNSTTGCAMEGTERCGREYGW